MSIDDIALVSIDGDARTRAEYILRPTLAQKATTNYQNTHRRPKTLFMCFLSHFWRLCFL